MNAEILWQNFLIQRNLVAIPDTTYINTLRSVFMSGYNAAIDNTQTIFVDISGNLATLSKEVAESKFKDYREIPVF